MDKKKNEHTSIYLNFLLRHQPEAAKLDMDKHGWVGVEQLIRNVNAAGRHTPTLERLQDIVASDSKGRYRFNEERTKIKACQGHSLEWVEPELETMAPLEYLYHGTNTEALDAIMESGDISRMGRHVGKMHADVEKAWKSARRLNNLD